MAHTDKTSSSASKPLKLSPSMQSPSNQCKIVPMLENTEQPAQKSYSAIRVAIHSEAYSALIDAARARMPAETVGALVGSVLYIKNKALVTINRIAPIERGLSSLGMGALRQEWEKVNEPFDTKDSSSSSSVVGWFYADPGMGVFPPRTEISVLQEVFAPSIPLFLLLNPYTDEGAFYTWHEGKYVWVETFEEVLPERSAPLTIPWDGEIRGAARWMELAQAAPHANGQRAENVPTVLADAAASTFPATTEDSATATSQEPALIYTEAADASEPSAELDEQSESELELDASAIEEREQEDDQEVEESNALAVPAYTRPPVAEPRLVRRMSRSRRRRIALLGLGGGLGLVVIAALALSTISSSRNTLPIAEASPTRVTAQPASSPTISVAAVAPTPTPQALAESGTPVFSPTSVIVIPAKTPTVTARESATSIVDGTPGTPQATPSPAATTATEQPNATQPAGQAVTYIVKQNDTLNDIAQRYNTTAGAIIRANGLKSTVIRVGQRLVIPASAEPATSPAPTSTRAVPAATRGTQRQASPTTKASQPEPTPSPTSSPVPTREPGLSYFPTPTDTYAEEVLPAVGEPTTAASIDAATPSVQTVETAPTSTYTPAPTEPLLTATATPYPTEAPPTHTPTPTEVTPVGTPLTIETIIALPR